MQPSFIHSGLDSVLVAIPFIGVLLAGMFRLDEVIAAPRRRKAPRRPAFRRAQDGRFVMTDPDGRPWNRGRSGR